MLPPRPCVKLQALKPEDCLMKWTTPCLATLMVFTAAAAEPRLTHLDYIRCTAHMEQASLKLISGQDASTDIEGSLDCRTVADDTHETVGLNKAQLQQLHRIIELFGTQLHAPTATVHMTLSGEITAFVEMLD